MNHHESHKTRSLRTVVVTSNIGFSTVGLTLAGFLPNLTGLTLMSLGVLVANVAQILVGVADLFFLGSTDADRAAIWNAWSVFALAVVAASFWLGWVTFGPGSLAILAVLAVLHVAVRIVRPEPPRRQGAAS